MVLGESGTGKSTSLRGFNAKDIGIFNAGGKMLPFKNPAMAKRCVNTDSMSTILETMPKTTANVLVIDDAQYLMANQYMRMANVTGYQKFTDIQKGFWDIVEMANKQLPPDKIVYFMMHIERDGNGHEKAKTIGKMLDEKITLEGMFLIVLKTCVQDGKYMFSTQNSGMDTVKTPIGMFDEPLIPNDLQYVDTVIRAYYGLAQLDEKVAPKIEPEKKPTEAAKGKEEGKDGA